MQQPLLAKSLKYGELPLEQHLIDTETAVQHIFKGRILKNWCRFFGVTDAERFLQHLRIAALFHDVGKANADFIALINGSREKQTLRHEWISALILHYPTVWQWLDKSGLDREAIVAAVLSHHLRATINHSEENWGQPQNQKKTVKFYLDHPQIQRIFQKIAAIAGLTGVPELPHQWVKGQPFWEQLYDEVNSIGRQFGRQIKRDKGRRALVLALKAGVIAADSVASGIFRTDRSEAIPPWVEQTLHSPCLTSEELEDKILQPRYKQIEEERKQPFQLKPFQEQAPSLGDYLLLLSGCGTGKTLFGYKWSQGVLSRHQLGRLIFLYPTRGTATEGFKDYVAWAPESDASLLTGTATYELNNMAENPSEATRDKDYTPEERLYALGFWGKRFFSATVDQFLSFLTHRYSGLCLLPVLADSVVIIDEVHSFSREMFDNLISFLEHFNIPVLCMTATLPPSRQKELRDFLEVFPTAENRAKLEELEKAEQHPRYQVQSCDYDTAYRHAIAAYQQGEREGERVLWVVNTVNRCREIATLLENDLPTEVLTYHSRFTLKDRQNRHSATVAAFKTKEGERKPAIAVTTQVCEMSLDLDADVLISETAPISSLVQRFGRSNRHLARGDDFRAAIWVYPADQSLPYLKTELENAEKFLGEVQGEVSQRQLAEVLAKYSQSEPQADRNSYFVRGGYWAKSESFREGNDYSVSAILDKDLDKVKQLIDDKKPYDGYILPIPKSAVSPQEHPDWLPKYLAIAPSDKYCSQRGFGQ
ncbi:CRISPR-associated helicase Cas3' [Spirulina sp. CS-785/01]|uniref:CRISPR-associated helicase Cas3' n=1 Tax=Spirulina sp. CS-785/01 TaxID=3021716 RepID=UPI00232C2C80|nr:CRISPR-associated helicase Cas3' [Spirulina sp. CS-785/01]MDB9311783.1 CRISPR-associated helicase Cas3' [Spirulina sp. CS-785/01]